MILIGYILRKTHTISSRLEKDLGAFLMRVILPFSILRSANTTFDPGMSLNLAHAALFAVAFYAFAIAALILIMRFTKLQETTKKIFVTLGTFQNVGFLGFPITEELYGPTGLIYTVIFNLVFQFFFLGFAQTYISGKRQNVVRSILTDPGIVASFLAIPLFVSPVKLPNVIADCFQLMGSMMTPISLLIIGCRMTSIRFLSLFTDGLAWILTAVRLAVLPTIAALVLKPLRLDPTLIVVLIMVCGLPSGAMNVILANEYDCDVNLASKTVALSTFIMLGSLPALMTLAR